MFFGTPKWSSKADNVYFLLGVSFSLNFYFMDFKDHLSIGHHAELIMDRQLMRWSRAEACFSNKDKEQWAR